jgi:tetrahydromethanopterin S-methyltransferase subunit H
MVDAAIEAITAMGSDFIFYGPMTGSTRVFSAVAAATSLLATLGYAEGLPLPSGDQPLNKLFPETVEQLLEEEGKES